MSPALILASGSPTRAALLRDAGVPFTVETARVDEESVKAAMLAEEAPARDIADALAELKAARVSARNPGALVLGADQVLTAGGTLYSKPAARDAARTQLLALRGRPHQLLSAAVIVEDGRPVWRHVGRATLQMRPFSNTFLETYLDAAGAGLQESVGGYKLEGLGAQLFARIDGDWFSILGLPLLEVLGYMRVRGVLQE